MSRQSIRVIALLVACGPSLAWADKPIFAPSFSGLKLEIYELQAPNAPKYDITLPAVHELRITESESGVRITRLDILSQSNIASESTGAMVDGHLDMDSIHGELRYLVMAENSARAFKWNLELEYQRSGSSHRQTVSVHSSVVPHTSGPTVSHQQLFGGAAPKTEPSAIKGGQGSPATRSDLAGALFGSPSVKPKPPSLSQPAAKDDFVARLVIAEENRKRNVYRESATQRRVQMERAQKHQKTESIKVSRSHREIELARLQREQEERERAEQEREEALARERERREQELAWAQEEEESQRASAADLRNYLNDAPNRMMREYNDALRQARDQGAYVEELMRQQNRRQHTESTTYSRPVPRRSEPNIAPPGRTTSPQSSSSNMQDPSSTRPEPSKVTRVDFGNPSSRSSSSASGTPNTTKAETPTIVSPPISIVGTNSTWLSWETAVDIAKVHAENQASERCGGGLYATISWESLECDDLVEKRDSGVRQSKCRQTVIVTCSNKPCKESFCGTGYKRR